mmetsp:Transcript_39000/g.63463  ORF Transcript_39000/g.63463 Transcript_39000/m.63463 type:complete len:210 (+) Transcript_39000:295-924(+)
MSHRRIAGAMRRRLMRKCCAFMTSKMLLPRMSCTESFSCRRMQLSTSLSLPNPRVLVASCGWRALTQKPHTLYPCSCGQPHTCCSNALPLWEDIKKKSKRKPSQLKKSGSSPGTQTPSRQWSSVQSSSRRKGTIIFDTRNGPRHFKSTAWPLMFRPLVMTTSATITATGQLAATECKGILLQLRTVHMRYHSVPCLAKHYTGEHRHMSS